VIGGKRPQLFHPQLPEGRQQFAFPVRAVNLVDDKKDLFVRPAQQVDDFSVIGGQAFPAVHEKQNDIGLLNSLHGLSADVTGHDVRLVINAAGINQDERLFVPGDLGVVAVPGHPGGRVDNGVAPAGHPVEQG
jgi:hypothetical protein